jgi:hypothetical protein
MRYIDINRLEELEDWPPGKLDKRYSEEKRRTPEGWRKHLSDAEAGLRNPPTGKTRAQVITRYSDLWSDVKDRYRDLSHGKCWYCESRTDRGDRDHYRPKGGVVENKNHPGYWWLAFEWRNWRFCCDRCNSGRKDPATGRVGGKGNQFPLADGEQNRIWDEGGYEDYEDLLDEDPLLLDPTMLDNVLLLTFTSNGLPGPITKAEHSMEYRRARASIRVYHLDHSILNRERRKIYCEVRRLIKDVQRYWKKWVKEYRKDDPEWFWVDWLLTAS